MNNHCGKITSIATLSGLFLLALPTPALFAAEWRDDSNNQDKENTIVVTAKANAVDDRLANSISVITAKDIENSGATDLQDILKNISGFNFTVNSSSIGGRKNIGLRGMDSEHILILIDGERMNASDAFIGHSNFQSNWVSLDNIHKIEVIKGSGSVLYGSEAIGGVINIITKSGAQKEYARILIAGSNLPNRENGEASNASFSAGHDISKQLYLTGNLSYSKRASADPYNYLAETPYGSYEIEEVRFEESIVKNIDLGVSYRLTNDLELTLNLNDSDEERNLVDPYYSIERNRYKLGLNTSLGQWDTSFKAYRNKGSFAWNSFGQFPYYTHIIEDAVVSAEFQGQFADYHYLTFGLENHQVDYFKDYQDPASTSDYRAKGTEQLSLYLQDNMTFASTSINIGARFDDNSQFNSGFSPSIGFVHRLSKGLSLTSSYTVAFLAPNIKQADDNYSFTQHGAGFSFKGNSALEPETSKNIELGVKYRGKQNSLGFSAYRNDVDDMITTAPLSPTEFIYSNVANATIKGVETTLQTDIGESFSLGASYNYMDTDDGSGRMLAYRPEHNLKTNLTFDYSDWTCVLSLNYNGDSVYYTTDQQRNELVVDVKSYSILDIAVNRDFSKNLRGQLAINNATDETLSDVDDNNFTELLGREIKFSMIMNF